MVVAIRRHRNRLLNYFLQIVLAACSGYFYDHFITADKLSAVSELPFSQLPLTGSRSDVMRRILCGIYR